MARSLTGSALPGFWIAGGGEPLAALAGGSAVSITTCQAGASSGPGSVKVTGSLCALNSSRKWQSVICSPRGPGSVIALPLRKTPSDRA
jgi:hypothetical protein